MTEPHDQPYQNPAVLRDVLARASVQLEIAQIRVKRAAADLDQAHAAYESALINYELSLVTPE